MLYLTHGYKKVAVGKKKSILFTLPAFLIEFLQMKADKRLESDLPAENVINL